MRLFYFFALLIFYHTSFAQQVSDPYYKPNIQNPEYEAGKGSIVFIDEGHYNFHTKSGRYKGFSNVLEADGYIVKPYTGLFEKEKLEKGKILVISNALHKANVQNWYLPNPSAFTKVEIEIVKKWVNDGGSLFLIADHMPMGGAAKDLAAAFGFEFTNAFALDTLGRGPAYFTIKEGTLIKNNISSGRNTGEKVKQVATFTGQAFKIPKDATPILVFNERFVNKLPDTAWVFNSKTKTYNVKGWSQGAYKKYGKGRIVAFGEAAMFTTQLAGPNKRKVGMNSEDAKENYKLLLNIIHWLDHKFDE
ncbi:DUF4350 domain-containing protein [Aquimarina gracilis]|uniref:DUF4350 domain-containing protein n=1 Tax=Aquimarina gracilis TaxID=874422 RepID=A0ABU5ZWF2_9FLAO|nr:DUF4350 domain-containing protein [Aquimarina gracilis]MEB3346177.1 DUF4350 domain-containing protein [Aquimarina gracilis]